MMLLAARALAGGYGGAEVVRMVDLDVAEGDCVAVLGPNGAGKSTLLRLLAGILPATSGTVELRGRPLASWRRREVAQTMGFVPQSVSFAFPLTVAEVVQQGRAPHLGPWRPPSPRDHAAVAAAIERVGLVGREHAAVQRLSGGERQLVLLARALASEPRVLLLDEPATALDVGHQLELVAILRELTGEGVGTIVVVHDWNFALRVANRVAVLHHGRLHAAGSAAQVLRPDLFREVFGVEVELIERPDGVPVLVPHG
ncbi:MAG: ABC transporter ATP-binding protein [Thermoanaerobaculaceae bacterium]|nr:ABC transporter ATP-binding protein [Thermoanaerobaculaceae bacterium]